MNKFDNIVGIKLQESIVSISEKDLDPNVFQKNDEGLPILRDAIRVQILKDIDEIRKILPVVKFHIIGNILSKNYNSRTPINISVQTDPQAVDSVSVADVMHALKYLNGRLAADTQHPIVYNIITDDLDETKIEAIYDVVNDKWIKIPEVYNPEVEKWVTKFQNTLDSLDINTGNLNRNLIDLEELKQLDSKNIKKLRISIKRKLQQLDEFLKPLIDNSKQTNIIKNIVFNHFSSPQELQEFGIRNKLSENILFKLLEKYYYIKFIKRIEGILDERNELELTDIPTVRKIMGDVWKPS